MATKIVITSGKGGVGKTTVTSNLGVALNNLGYRVLLIDLDFGLNNLDVVMGIENRVSYDILDVFEGRCRVKQALVEIKEHKNLFVLPSITKTVSSISGQNIKLIIEKVNAIFDYIILDCPAGIDVGFHRAISIADEAIVVTTPQLSSLRDADKVISILKSYRLDRVSLAINRVRGDLILENKMMMPSDVEGLLKTNLIGVLPEEDIVFLSSGGVPKNSSSYKAYKILSQNLIKNTKKIYDTTSKYSGFFGSIKRGLKRL
ncbi:MAG: septum site-determining protein MinD [Clostridia bacterium]|nr:septum site-determining protein MinD [Clostridia bacterium]